MLTHGHVSHVSARLDLGGDLCSEAVGLRRLSEHHRSTPIPGLSRRVGSLKTREKAKTLRQCGGSLKSPGFLVRRPVREPWRGLMCHDQAPRFLHGRLADHMGSTSNLRAVALDMGSGKLSESIPLESGMKIAPGQIEPCSKQQTWMSWVQNI